MTLMKMKGKVNEYLKGISQDEFDKIIADNKLVIVDCFAEWCMPCHRMKPIFKKLAESEEFKEVEFVTIDTDNCEWINGEYNIDSIPRFLFFENGKLIYEHKGSSPEEVFSFLLKEKLLHADFEHYDDNSGISKEKFDEIVKKEDLMVAYLYKEGGRLNGMFKPSVIIASENYNDIHFCGISIDKTPWIKEEFDLKDEEYEKFGDPEKKLPYYLFYKNGKLIKEKGVMRPEEFDGVLMGPMLDMIKVEEFEEGIKKEEFDKIIEENKLVMVDIFTTWCGPCQIVRPIFQALSGEYEQIKFISVDLDQSRWLGAHEDYGTNAIPTFLFLKDGKLVEKHVGGMDKEGFEKIIKEKLLD
ncbi:MAG: hypothetical protein GF364_03505 [Candidatus Lokiarchaeota archaeon]|nr:hypothetical protein [Candidatus Lokiarchaeota archaeon]